MDCKLDGTRPGTPQFSFVTQNSRLPAVTPIVSHHANCYTLPSLVRPLVSDPGSLLPPPSCYFLVCKNIGMDPG
jgi:hypothetical protein